MGITWKQKVEVISQFVQENYTGLLRQEGFVSYQDKGLSWYKVDNGLLYTIHLMSIWPRPFDIRIRYAVHPLFSWEHIAYTNPLRDWPRYFEEPEHGVDHNRLWGLAMAAAVLGGLQRPFEKYQKNYKAYYLQDVFVTHWNTERKGAELFEEIVFPVLRKMNSIEIVYDYHKTIRLMNITDNTSPNPGVSFLAEDDYLDKKKRKRVSNQFGMLPPSI